MKSHARTDIVRRAENELSGRMLDLVKAHRLTFAERFSILASLASDTAKYALRAERHPEDPSRPADVE
jgi:hypothetical protein